MSTPEDTVASANATIETTRAFKRLLIWYHPIEKKVQEALENNPEVASARFALSIYSLHEWRGIGFAIPYAVVITMRGEATEDEVGDIIVRAFESAGIRTERHPQLVQHGNTWATKWSTCYISEDVNPDITAIEDDK